MAATIGRLAWNVVIALRRGLGMKDIEIKARLADCERSGHKGIAHQARQNFFLEGFTPKVGPRVLRAVKA